MPVHPHWPQLSLALAFALALLPACRQPPEPSQPLPQPANPPGGTPTVTAPASVDQRSASDHPDASPAMGAMTANQDGGGARKAPIQPTGGDGTAAASAASAPASR